MSRPDWDTYFLRIAVEASSRATCDRKHVGAVLVRDKNILSTGYNGAPRGMPHCDDVGHLMENDHCVRVSHAESNAITSAAKNGVRTDGSTMYTTASPCWLCFKELVNAGCKRVVFGELYRDSRISSFAKEAGIELLDFSNMPGWRKITVKEIDEVVTKTKGELTEQFCALLEARRNAVMANSNDPSWTEHFADLQNIVRYKWPWIGSPTSVELVYGDPNKCQKNSATSGGNVPGKG